MTEPSPIDPPRGDEPTYLAAHLQELLARDARVNEPELVVTVGSDRISIDGVVPTRERREAVTAVIEEACPDRAVDNRTSVADYEPPADRERIT